MGPDPTYDDLSVFFASYMELSALYNAETLSCHGRSSSSSGGFPHRLRRAPTVIAALVARGHLPTFDDLEFIGMVENNRDFIFDALYTDSDSGLSFPTSSKEEPLTDEEGKDRPTSTAPMVVPAKWGTTHGRNQRDH